MARFVVFPHSGNTTVRQFYPSYHLKPEMKKSNLHISATTAEIELINHDMAFRAFTSSNYIFAKLASSLRISGRAERLIRILSLIKASLEELAVIIQCVRYSLEVSNLAILPED